MTWARGQSKMSQMGLQPLNTGQFEVYHKSQQEPAYLQQKYVCM